MPASIVRPLAATAALAVLLVAPRGSAAQEADSMLVTQSWLASHLNDPNVVVIHVAGTRRDYLNGHVPGARFLWTGTFAPSTPDLSTELPPVAQVDSALESLGIGDRTRIVIYGPNMPMTA